MSVHPLWALPFVVLLACIAVMPLAAHRWWERHYPKVALTLAVVSAGYYLFVRRDLEPWLHYMEEYVSFIALLASLYVVSGGVMIRVGRKATPLANTVLLVIGSILANIFGTTGASMLLIRPYLRMNRGHVKPYHVVFFIFTVSNIGGALTPIGDPPLFLGYLQGVPFWWVFERCRTIWALTLGIILGVFFLIDSLDHGKFERVRADEDDPGPAVHILGVHNFLFIGIILFAVFQTGFFDAAHALADKGFSLPRVGRLLASREILMFAALVAARRFTSPEIYERNDFNWGPIREVAILFVGIFSTMAPALEYVRANADRVGIRTPGQYYFASGSLSSFLDNAPTYLTFLELKLSTIDQAATKPEQLAILVSDPRLGLYLIAISLGSVFFGACTYIGNGPNFMVKSIADSLGVKTPGFLAYVLKYALPVLIPVYVLVWWLFLRR
jgi:Na+/H+ antiporter NhaD/arsenite permease-like protein